jgi:3',5'-cyclic AMP phosphodiesterase CpdA
VEEREHKEGLCEERLIGFWPSQLSGLYRSESQLGERLAKRLSRRDRKRVSFFAFSTQFLNKTIYSTVQDARSAGSLTTSIHRLVMNRILVLLFLLGASALGFAQTPTQPSTPPKEEAKEKSAKAPTPPGYSNKLIHTPTPMPDRIILTWKSDPATSQAVTWRTDTSVTKSVAEFTISEDGPAFDTAKGGKRPDPTKVKRVNAITTPFENDLNSCHYHSAEFLELKPNTRYVYRVGQLMETSVVNWSEWFEFKTPTQEPSPLRFIYFGDAQNEVKAHWSRVIRGAYSDMPKAHFLLHAGDLINRANADGEWGEWHQAAGWINGHIPSVPTPGNHEYGAPPKTKEPKGIVEKLTRPKPVLTPHWRVQFTLPEHGPKGLEETAFYHDIQGVRVISLNSNEMHKEQIPWLENVLATNPNKWTVVTFHHPVYSTAATRQKEEEGKAVRQLWRPILDKYGVDLVLQGHDHSYGRSGLMNEDNVLSGTQVFTKKGTIYAVSVSGPKMYELGVQPWMVSKAEKKQLYQLITINGKKLHYEARTANGELYDEFELRKRNDGGNTLVEREELEKERVTPAKEKNPTRSELIIALIAMVTLAISFGIWKVMTRSSGKTHAAHHHE